MIHGDRVVTRRKGGALQRLRERARRTSRATSARSREGEVRGESEGKRKAWGRGGWRLCCFGAAGDRDTALRTRNGNPERDSATTDHHHHHHYRRPLPHARRRRSGAQGRGVADGGRGRVAHASTAVTTVASVEEITRSREEWTDDSMAPANDMADSLTGELERLPLEAWPLRGGGDAWGMLPRHGSVRTQDEMRVGGRSDRGRTSLV